MAAVVLGAGQTRAMSQSPASPGRPAPIDPQVVRDQDDMTWDDYVPIPGATWNDPTKVASQKTIKLAIVMADFPDEPFVMTLPKHSDKYGNPQVDGIKREEIVPYTMDFYTKPGKDNHGHTIHEYWMEQSRGKVGVAVTVFGPYRMPSKSYQYGMGGGMNGNAADAMPTGEEPSKSSFQADIDKLWQTDAGADVRGKFDLVMRTFAGYDESAVWQEFGEMKFQTRDDIPAIFGNPDPTKPRWAKTRYVEWTSWDAAKWVWSNSAIITGEASGAIRHEVSHAAFSIGDNYNNPYVQPYRRVASGPWDLMDRGSFNGPGGPHKRYLVPKTEGDVMSAGIMLRQKVAWNFVTPEQVLTVNRDGLAKSGLVVAKVMARAVDPEPASGVLSGIVVRLDGAPNPAQPALAVVPAPVAVDPAAAAGGRGAGAGAAGAPPAGGRGGGRGGPPAVWNDRTPVEDPTANPLSSGTPDYNFYTMEVVQRMGYDSYCPDNGVLLAKNKDRASSVGGPNAFSVFNWVIDAHPEDIKKLDFKRPDGTPVMRTIADYRQLNDALFHAGTNSGSQYEWIDTPNRLHFYVIDVVKDGRGVLTYTVGVKSLDGVGPQQRGVSLTAPAAGTIAAGSNATTMFAVKNTGAGAALPSDAHATDVSKFAGNDIYRLSVSVTGSGWSAMLPNELVSVAFGASAQVPVFIAKGATGAAAGATITVKATSESDPTKTATAVYRVK